MARVLSRSVVIDASVARAAGHEGATSLTAEHCRDFLYTVRDLGHCLVFTDALEDEWNRNQSGFAARWRRSMFARRRVIWREAEADTTLRKQIADAAREPGVAAKMLKDCHLIEAALASEMRIASLDDSVRLHFRQAALIVRALRALCWVNPDSLADDCLVWLAAGAPLENHRRFGYVPPEE